MIATALAAALLGVCGDTVAAGPAQAHPAGPGVLLPQHDSFYLPPPRLTTLHPGDIVAVRPVVALGVPAGTDAWQISFRSNDSHNRAILAVTTLLVPSTPWPGPGTRPAVSAQFAEDSTALRCAPSYTLRVPASAGLQAGEITMPVALLQRGWAVAVPDHEGPRSALFAGYSGAHVVLDSIRAANHFSPGGLGPQTRWGVTGYSGGAFVSAWAAQLQPTYAPEIRLIGAAIGGMPSDLSYITHTDGSGPASPLTLEALAGIDNEYPEAHIAELLNPRGTQVFSGIRALCAEQALLAYPFTDLRELTTVPDLSAVPSVAAVMADNTLGHYRPRAPIYDYHGELDEVLAATQDDAAVRQWCAQGAVVHTVRDPLEHITEGTAHQQDAVNFLADRFTGQPTPDNC